MQRIVAGLVIACAAGRSLGAQIPALRTESRMITQIGDNAPDTSIVCVISAGKRHRLEFIGHPPASMDPFSGKSTVQILSFADSEVTIDYVDDSAKTYIELKPLLMMKKANAMVAAIGASMKMESTADTVTVDSLAGTEVVMGYRTVHFHALSAHSFRMTLMGENATMGIRQSFDTYVAPDAKRLIAGLTDSLVTSAGAGGVLSALGAGTPPGMDSVMMRAAAKMGRINAAGVPLKSVIEMETSMEGPIRLRQRQEMEVLKMERITVPESTFTVPKDYKKTEFELPTGGPVSGT